MLITLPVVLPSARQLLESSKVCVVPLGTVAYIFDFLFFLCQTSRSYGSLLKGHDANVTAQPSLIRVLIHFAPRLSLESVD